MRNVKIYSFMYRFIVFGQVWGTVVVYRWDTSLEMCILAWLHVLAVGFSCSKLKAYNFDADAEILAILQFIESLKNHPGE